MLQETFLTLGLEAIIKLELDYHCFFNHGTNHSKGVAIFVRKYYSEQIEHFVHLDGRALAIRLKVGENSYFILNVYAPTKHNEKERFYNNLLKWLKKGETSKRFISVRWRLELCSKCPAGYSGYVLCL